MKILLIGNPNVGKTTLFNALTGAHNRTGNYHGVTVGVSERPSRFPVLGTVCDLPGLYSLDGLSMEEKLAGDYIEKQTGSISPYRWADAAHLKRSLKLTESWARPRHPRRARGDDVQAISRPRRGDRLRQARPRARRQVLGSGRPAQKVRESVCGVARRVLLLAAPLSGNLPPRGLERNAFRGFLPGGKGNLDRRDGKGQKRGRGGKERAQGGFEAGKRRGKRV